MTKYFRIGIIVLAVIVGSLVMAWLWLTQTDSGARWALSKLPIEFQDTHGNFRHGLEISGLRLQTDQASIIFDQVELAVRIQLRPRPRLQVQQLHLTDGNINIHRRENAGDTPPDRSGAPQLPRLPFDLTLRDAQVKDTTIADGGSLYVINTLRLYARADQRLEISKFLLETPEVMIEGMGQLDLAAPHALDAEISARIALPAQPEVNLTINAGGDLHAVDWVAETSGLADLRLEGNVLQPLTDPQLNAVIAGQINANDQLQLPDHHLMVEIAGSLNHLDVSNLAITTLEGEITGNASVDRAATLADSAITLNLHLAELSFTHLFPEWPEQARVNGSLRARLQNQVLALTDLNLRAPPNELTLEGRGEINLDTHNVDLEIDWSQLMWPPTLNQQTPLVESERGTIQLTGALEDWRLKIDAHLTALGDPSTQLVGALNGDTHQIRIDQLTLKGQTVGVLDLEGEIQYQPEWMGLVRVSLDQFDPSIVVNELPGQINADLRLELRDQELWTVDVLNLGGELRGQPLSGQGQLALKAYWPQQGRLELALGDNQLRLTSDTSEDEYREPNDLWHLAIDAPTLERVWPTLSGSLSLDATLDAQHRKASFEGRLNDSSHEGITLGQATISGTLDAGDHPSVDLVGHITDLDLNPWDRIERIDLNLVGDCLGHTLSLKGISQRGTLTLDADGALNHCDLNQITSWTGQLNHLMVSDTIAGNWQLQAPMPMQIGDTSQFGPGCLTDETGRLCLSALTLGQSNSAAISVENLPINLLMLPLDPAFRLDSTLSGSLTAIWEDDPGLTHLSGELAIGSGAITTPDSDLELLRIMGVSILLTPMAEYLQVELSAALDGDSEIQGQLRIDDLNDLSSAQMIGNASLTLPDIAVFAPLITEIDQLNGRLDGNVALSGPLLAPLIQGTLDLTEGQLVHAPLGLNLTEIALQLDANQDQAQLNGQLTAGTGQLNIAGQLEQQDQQWQGRLELNGQTLTLADVSWLHIESSPQLRLDWQPGRIDLDGDIKIDRMRAGLPPGRAERIDSSPDITIVQPRQPTVAEADAPITLFGRLGIDLGPAARVEMIGIQTQLTGELNLDWDGRSPNPTPRGTIALRDGSYRAFGQNLAIDSGQVVFTGHRIQNPAINVEATRDIFGDPRVTLAGVRIRGQAQDPDIILFTDPPTTDEKALAYLVTGADFDYAGGQAAVNVGVYLLPRLLVSYGFGLLETGNVLSGRYELSRRWGIRAVSGERDTGVDLSYAIDR